MPDAPGLVLAIDTSTDVCVGVARNGEVLARTRLADNRAHVEQLVPLTTTVLAEAGVTLDEVSSIVVGLGPGPFTGLRVGVATAQVLAAARGIDLHSVCSLDVIALAAAQDEAAAAGEFVVATDARRKEVYWARYDAAGSRVDGPHVAKPTDLPELPVIGPGADLYALPTAEPGPRSLDAGLLAARGLDLPSAGSTPLYLRRPDAAVPSTPKTTLISKPRVRSRRRSTPVEPVETQPVDTADPPVEPVETQPVETTDPLVEPVETTEEVSTSSTGVGEVSTSSTGVGEVSTSSTGVGEVSTSSTGVVGDPLVEPVETTPATLEDLPALLALEESGFGTRERWSSDSWRAELTGEDRTVLVARSDAGVVGAATVQTVGPTADLHRIVVDPTGRRSGIGRRLVAAAVEAAERAGARKVVLEVRYDNEPAIALYQGLGFEQVGVRTDYYGAGKDALILKLYDLDPDHPGSAVEGAS